MQVRPHLFYDKGNSMGKYLIKRLLHGIVSIVIVVAIVMILIYSLMNRDLIFAKDSEYSKKKGNTKEIYQQQQWEKYGYVDYVHYNEYIQSLVKDGTLTQDEVEAKGLTGLGKKAENDSDDVKEYVQKFTQHYQSQGYKIVRLDRKDAYKSDGRAHLYAVKDVPLISRLWSFFTGLIKIDTVRYVKEDIGERGLTFTFKDPVYGGEKFSPAIMGNGTRHKYLLYFDSSFPFIHQNLVTIQLGKSYVINDGIDVFETMVVPQGNYVKLPTIFPTGLQTEAANDLHTATYAAGSRDAGELNKTRFTDDYTVTTTRKNAMPRIGFSFVIGVLAVIMSYLLGVPLGVIMARRKGGIADKIGTIYIVFIIAVPSLAYIFMFKAIGHSMGIPSSFDMNDPTNKLMYILPIVSLALPSVANLMKWIRRYMIDQLNSDYVKFARSGGLSEGEIFSKHVLKNAIIPIVHGIPGSVLGAMTGAIITESVYNVPGTGGLLVEAINAYDNGVIVGVTLFYAVLSVISIILGDVLMALVDPRISYTSKGR